MKRDPQVILPRRGLSFHHAARSGLGRISAAGWLSHGGMEGWRDLGSHAVALIVAGQGTYQDERGLEMAVEAGSLIVSFPGLRHCYRPTPGSEWTEYYLMFDGPVFGLWEQVMVLDRANPVLRIHPVEHWAHQFESVLGATGRLGADPPLVEICRLQAVLAGLLWHGTGRAVEAEDLEWGARARTILESTLHPELAMAGVARRLGLSAAAFRRKFARLVGETPARYRTARLIDRACQLMQSTTLLDKQIAGHLGFCDEYYFSRRFRQVTGKSPREFRADLPQGGGSPRPSGTRAC